MKASKHCFPVHSQVRTKDPTCTEGRCWVVQNTWGTDAGYNGLWLVNMDTPCLINALPQPLVSSTCDGRMCINHSTLTLRACSKYIFWKRPGEAP